MLSPLTPLGIVVEEISHLTVNWPSIDLYSPSFCGPLHDYEAVAWEGLIKYFLITLPYDCLSL